jgi:hypothetical protein
MLLTHCSIPFSKSYPVVETFYCTGFFANALARFYNTRRLWKLNSLRRSAVIDKQANRKAYKNNPYDEVFTSWIFHRFSVVGKKARCSQLTSPPSS